MFHCIYIYIYILLAGADRRAVRDDVRLHAPRPHGAEELQRVLPPPPRDACLRGIWITLNYIDRIAGDHC